MSNKVVVTGMGGICSLGSNIDQIYENAKNGINGIDVATQFDTEEIPNVHFTSEVKDFDPSKYLKKRELKRLDRFTQFAIMLGWKHSRIAGLRSLTLTGLE